MNKTLKKTLSIILTVLMIVTTVPFAFAADVSLVINMTDSDGDGWTGNAVVIEQIIDGTYTKVATATIEDGESGTFTAILSEDGVYAFRWVEGSYSYECSFTVTVDGDIVFEATDGSKFKNGQIIYVLCEHSAENGICSKCGFECGVDFEHEMTDSICTVCGRYIYAITHQPTEEEPYVELNDDTDASYQWYKVESSETEITDENAEAFNPEWLGIPGEEFITTAKYADANGWIPAVLLDNSALLGYFGIELKAGETVSFEFSSAPMAAGIMNLLSIEEFFLIMDGTKASFTAKEDGMYVLMAQGTMETITVKAYFGEATYTKIDGETAAELENIVYGKKYACEVTYGDGTKEMSDTVDFSYKITHQPTVEEPYVELNDDTGATYQWYKVEGGKTEFTDENAEAFDPRWLNMPDEMFMTTATYYDEIGWTPAVLPADDVVSSLYFGVELNAGETVSFEFSSAPMAAGIMNLLSIEEFFLIMDGTKASFTAEENGMYVLIAQETMEEFGAPITVKAYFGEATYTKIDGETAAELENIVYGKRYACEVTFADGTTEMSDVLDLSYKITHLPTAAEPYVELNYDTGATYQWYSFELNETEVTDENASTVSYDWGESSYDKETGWTGVPYMEDYYGWDFFTVALEAGETVVIEVTGDFADGVGLYDYDTEEAIWVDYIEGVTSYELTVESEGNYTFYTYVNSGVVTVKAYFDEVPYTAIEGETAAELTNPVVGNKYACEVTFADGTKEMSETFEATTVHTCDFSGEWKYDGTKHWKECDCGLTGEEANHEFEDYTVTTPADCENNAWETGYCECGATDEREVPDSALGHTPSGWWAKNETEHWRHCVNDSCSEEIEGTREAHSFTEGVCSVCDYACNHDYGEGVLTRPTATEKGYYTYTCTVCDDTYTEEVARADYSEFDAAVAELQELLATEGLLDAPKQGYTSGLNGVLNSVGYNRIEKEQVAVDNGVQSLKGYIAAIKAGIENGSMIKADFTYMTELFAEINELIGSDTGKIIPSQRGLYTGTLAYYNGCSNNPTFTQQNYNSNISYEKDLEALLAGLKDGSMLVADYTEIDEAIAEIEQKLADENVTDEAKAGLEEIKSQLEELKDDGSTSKADLAELEKALEDYEAEIDAGIEDGTAVEADYTEIDEAIKAIDEALEDATINDEMRAELEDIKADLEALKENADATQADVADELADLLDRAEAITETMNNCAKGIHSFTKYEETEAPECGVVGKEVATCDNGCGATDENEIPALEHIDENGDYLCDNDCGHEFEKPTEPDTPDVPADGNCDHICHKDGILGFFWKIISFLQRLFGIQQYCDCGALHYEKAIFG